MAVISFAEQEQRQQERGKEESQEAIVDVDAFIAKNLINKSKDEDAQQQHALLNNMREYLWSLIRRSNQEPLIDKNTLRVLSKKLDSIQKRSSVVE